MKFFCNCVEGYQCRETVKNLLMAKLAKSSPLWLVLKLFYDILRMSAKCRQTQCSR